MKSYSDDLRKRVIALRSKGHTGAEVAVLFSLSKRTVERYWRRYRDTGSVSPKRRGGYRRSRLEGHDSTLKGWISKEADLTLEQLKERIREQLDISLGTTALWHRLERLGLSYKKNPKRRRAREI
jgi:transposase